MQTFWFHALDYLLKPFDDRLLEQALQRLEALFAPRKSGDYYGQALLSYLNGVEADDNPALPRDAERLAIRSVGHIESVAAGKFFGPCPQIVLSSCTIRRSNLHRVTMTNFADRQDSAVFFSASIDERLCAGTSVLPCALWAMARMKCICALAIALL